MAARSAPEDADGGLRIHSRLRIPASELRETASRSRGPGGQHGDKASTRVTLRWNVWDSRVLGESARDRLCDRLESRLTRTGAIVVHADEHRSRERNRQAARDRLAALVREALRRPRPRRATRPTRASRERVLAAKRRRSDVKQRRGRVRDDD